MDGHPGELPSDEERRPVPGQAEMRATDLVEDAGPPRDLPKAPLVVLGVVVCSLLAILTGKVMVTGAVGETSTVATDAGQTARQPPAGSDRHVGGTGDLPSAGAQASSPGDSATEELAGTGYLVQTVATGFREDFAGLVSEEEARCMARVVLDELGADRLWALTEAMAEQAADPGSFDGNDPRMLGPAEVDELNARLRPCVSAEAAERLDFG